MLGRFLVAVAVHLWRSWMRNPHSTSERTHMSLSHLPSTVRFNIKYQIILSSNAGSNSSLELLIISRSNRKHTFFRVQKNSPQALFTGAAAAIPCLATLPPRMRPNDIFFLNRICDKYVCI